MRRTTLIGVQTLQRVDPHVHAGEHRERVAARGVLGNERLTALAGAALLIPLAIIGVTILRIHGLLWLHLFVGMLLVPPVLLKLASTLYRFGRYYTRNAAYRLRGAPPLALRALGPAVVLTTLIVFASGIALMYTGPSERSTLLPIHKVSFIAWLAFTAVHVLAHLIEMRDSVGADVLGKRIGAMRVPGRELRALAVGAALVLGTGLAVLVIPEFSSWTGSSAHFHGDH
jgi:hypothetical protein